MAKIISPVLSSEKLSSLSGGQGADRGQQCKMVPAGVGPTASQAWKHSASECWVL